MKITDLITQLEKIKNEKGDLHIVMTEKGFGGYAVNSTSNNVDLSEIRLGDFLDTDDDFMDDDLCKEFFPEWDGDIDSEQDLTIEVVDITSDALIYST